MLGTVAFIPWIILERLALNINNSNLCNDCFHGRLLNPAVLVDEENKLEIVIELREISAMRDPLSSLFVWFKQEVLMQLQIRSPIMVIACLPLYSIMQILLWAFAIQFKN